MARKAAAQVKEDTPRPPESPILTEDIEIDLSEPIKPEETGNGATTPEPVVIEAAPESESPAPAEDAEKVALRKRLQEMEDAERLAREQATKSQQQIQQFQQAQWQAQRQAWDAKYDSVVNSVGAAQEVLASAKQRLMGVQRAAAAGDIEASAQIPDLIEEVSQARYNVSKFEDAKEQLDNQLEAWKRQQQQRPQQPQQQQPAQQQSVESIITNSGLPARVQTWLRAHPDYITDASKNAKMQEMHYVAKYQTGEEFTDAYVAKMEELLGMKQQGNGAAAPIAQASTPTPQRQSAPVSAPPTREAPSMSTGRVPQPTRVTLTPDEQEIAWQSRTRDNMTRREANEEYAKQKIELQKRKARGEIS